jgi:ABC-type branched-subunit amino acid transport system substrate-binding protein
VLRQFKARFHTPGTSYALYGYEAMMLVLDAIRSSAKLPISRESVVQAAFHLKQLRSVLGPYEVLPDGETTIVRYGADVLRNGKAVFWRELPISGPHVP